MNKTFLFYLLLAFLIPFSSHAQIVDRPKGYSGAFELYGGFGKNQVYQNWTEIGFQTVHGYRFSNRFSMHLGVGLQTDRMWPMILPVHLDARVDLGRSAVRPFLQAGIGYGVPLLVEIGGVNVQFALGLRMPVSNRLGIIASIASRFQAHSEEVYGPYMVLSRFVEFRLGLAFGS